MRNSALLSLALFALLSSPHAAGSEAQAAGATTAAVGLDSLLLELADPPDEQAFDAPAFAAARCRPASQCCKICSKGKACGDTCISRRYTCHQGRGCACNRSELC